MAQPLTNRQSLSWSRISPTLMEPLWSKACPKSGAVDLTRTQTNLSQHTAVFIYVALISPRSQIYLPINPFPKYFRTKLTINFSYFSQALYATRFTRPNPSSSTQCQLNIRHSCDSSLDAEPQLRDTQKRPVKVKFRFRAPHMPTMTKNLKSLISD